MKKIIAIIAIVIGLALVMIGLVVNDLYRKTKNDFKKYNEFKVKTKNIDDIKKIMKEDCKMNFDMNSIGQQRISEFKRWVTYKVNNRNSKERQVVFKSGYFIYDVDSGLICSIKIP